MSRLVMTNVNCVFCTCIASVLCRKVACTLFVDMVWKHVFFGKEQEVFCFCTTGCTVLFGRCSICSASLLTGERRVAESAVGLRLDLCMITPLLFTFSEMMPGHPPKTSLSRLRYSERLLAGAWGFRVDATVQQRWWAPTSNASEFAQSPRFFPVPGVSMTL